MKYRSSTPTSPRATILFADDDPDTCEMMKTLLGFQGYDVVTARDGCEAIEVARQKFPQLILLDLEIPKLNGISVAKTLKCDRRFKRVPIVIISGHNPSRFRQQALDAGCDEYLLKTLDFSRIQELLARIQLTVSAQRLRGPHHAAAHSLVSPKTSSQSS